MWYLVLYTFKKNKIKLMLSCSKLNMSILMHDTIGALSIGYDRIRDIFFQCVRSDTIGSECPIYSDPFRSISIQSVLLYFPCLATSERIRSDQARPLLSCYTLATISNIIYIHIYVLMTYENFVLIYALICELSRNKEVQ